MGSYTIREMARKFGMQPSTLRYYEDQGLLTDVGRAEFRQSYDALAIAALRRLSQEVGPDAVRQLSVDQFACVEERFLAAREARPEQPAIEALVEALDIDGYAPSVRPVHSGTG